MIKPNHRLWAHFIFEKYIRNKVRKDFHSINVVGTLPKIDANKSLIITPNHISWWDGFFPYLMNIKYWKKKYNVLMLEHQLKRYYFFNYIGAFSINQSKPKEIINSINFCKDLISFNENLLVFFPEGEMKPSFESPSNYKTGIEKVVSDKTQILVQATYFLNYKEELPNLYFAFSLIENPLEIPKLASYIEKTTSELIKSIENSIKNSLEIERIYL
jgi:hypothetical protein